MPTDFRCVILGLATFFSSWLVALSAQSPPGSFVPYSPNLVDTTFKNNFPAPSTILPLPDGKVLLVGGAPYVINGQVQAGYTMLNADGTYDSSFAVSTGLGSAGSVAPRALLQPDGKVVIWGSFQTVNGIARANAVRLNADGSMDSTFAPDPTQFVAANAVVPNALVLLPSGEFLLFAVDDAVLSWRLLTSTGAVDPNFGPAARQTDLAAAVTPDGTVKDVFATVDAAGNTWVVVSGNRVAVLGNETSCQLFRINPAANLDSTFSQGRVFSTILIQQLMPFQGDMMYAGINLTSFGVMAGAVGRLLPDGTNDPTWPQRQFASGSFPVSNGGMAALLPDGSAVTFNSIPLPGGTIFGLVALGYDLQRITPDDQLDPNFGGILSAGAAQSPDQQFFPLPNGQIFFVGGSRVNNWTSNGLFRLTFDTHYPQTRLVNFSSLGSTDSQPFDLGFVIVGSGSQNLLLRSAGPALGSLGVHNPAPDPQITLSGSGVTLTDDNWGDQGATSVAAAAATVGAFPFAVGSKDAAIVTSLPAGTYSLQTNAPGGISLTELYDASAAPTDAAQGRLINASVLISIAPTTPIATAGFVLGGPGARRLLIRAIGPSLASFGVSNSLPDPKLNIYASSVAVGEASVENANQTIDPALVRAVGAFPLSVGALDPVWVLDCSAGAYTIQVSSISHSSGTVLIEIYEVP